MRLNNTARGIKFSAEDMSVSALTAAIQSALGNDPDNDGDEDYPWIVDVFPGRSMFIYSCDGQLFEQAYAMSGEGEVSLVGSAREVKEERTYTPVAMAQMSSRIDGEDVIYEGEIFRSGSYADKGCEASPEDLVQIARRFDRPAPIHDQHQDRSPFYRSLHETDENGKLKYGLMSVRAMEAGKWLWGQLRLPKWVAEALGDEVPVSVGIFLSNGRPWQIYETSLVDEGRVPTAVVSRKLAAAFVAFAGSRHSKADAEDIQRIHDLAVSQGATCTAAEMSRTHPISSAQAVSQTAKEKRMNSIEKIKALFGRNPKASQEDVLAELHETQPQAGLDPDVAARLAKFEVDNQALRADVDRQNEVILRRAAADFATQAIEKDRKALPAEREDLEALFVMAAKADGANGRAKFADSGSIEEGDNVGALRKSIVNRPSLSAFAKEQIPGAGASTDADEAARRAAQAQAAERSLHGSVSAYNKRGNN